MKKCISNGIFLRCHIFELIKIEALVCPLGLILYSFMVPVHLSMWFWWTQPCQLWDTKIRLNIWLRTKSTWRQNRTPVQLMGFLFCSCIIITVNCVFIVYFKYSSNTWFLKLKEKHICFYMIHVLKCGMSWLKDWMCMFLQLVFSHCDAC